jgi:hypothetical protein
VEEAKTRKFKACVTVGKGKGTERILYCKALNIMDVWTITKKVRAKKLHYIVPITHEEYIQGVQKG